MATAVSVDNEKQGIPKPRDLLTSVRAVLDHQTILSYEYVFKYVNVTVNTLIANTESKHFVVADFPLETPEDYKASPSLRPVALFRLSATARKQQRRQQ
jgi:hypothetical protein